MLFMMTVDARRRHGARPVPPASAGWRWNWNARATQDQIKSVLAAPTRLEIRGEFRTGPDVGGLDTFVLMAGAG
jgi:hypothetical protein